MSPGEHLLRCDLVGRLVSATEEVAQPMVEGFGGTITRLTPDQASYINVEQIGPFKPDSYKY